MISIFRASVDSRDMLYNLSGSTILSNTGIFFILVL